MAARTAAAKPKGRPSKYTEDRVVEIINTIRMGCYEVTAARAHGVSETTFHEWKNKYPDFKERVEQARAFAETRYVSVVRRAAESDHDWHAAAWWLERSYPDRWGRRQRLELAGDPDAPIGISLTEEEVKTVADELRTRVVRLADARRAREAAA